MSFFVILGMLKFLDLFGRWVCLISGRLPTREFSVFQGEILRCRISKLCAFDKNALHVYAQADSRNPALGKKVREKTCPSIAVCLSMTLGFRNNFFTVKGEKFLGRQLPGLSQAGGEGQREGLSPPSPPFLADQLTLSQPGGCALCPPNNTGTPAFSGLPTALYWLEL